MADNKKTIESIPGFKGSNKKGDISFTVQPSMYQNGTFALEAKFWNEDEKESAGVDIITVNPENIGLEKEQGAVYVPVRARYKEIVDALDASELVKNEEITLVPVAQEHRELIERLQKLEINGIFDDKELNDKKYFKLSLSEDVQKLAMLNRASIG